MILLLPPIATVVVIGLFQALPSKIAGALAGVLFLIVATICLLHFYKKLRYGSLAFWAWSVFLVGLAVPIFVLRISNWHLPSEEIFLFSIGFDFLHKASEKAYVFAFLASILDVWRIKKAAS